MHLQSAGGQGGQCHTPALAGFQRGGRVDADESGLKGGTVRGEPLNQGAEVGVDPCQAPGVRFPGVGTKHPRLNEPKPALAALKQREAQAACAGVNAEYAGATG